MPDCTRTLDDLAQAFGLLGQPPYVSLLAQQRALAQAGEQDLTVSSLVQQQQALLHGALAQPQEVPRA